MIYRDIVKVCARRVGMFSLSSIVEATGYTRLQARRSMEMLEREGCVKRVTERKIVIKGENRNRPVKEINYTSTRLLKEQDHFLQNVRRKDTAWERIWRAMRTLRRFTKNDVVVATDATRGNVTDYLKRLHKSGHVRLVGFGVWMLVNDIGPKRPSVVR